MKKLLLLLLFQCGMILGDDAKPDCEKQAIDHCPEIKPRLELPESEEDINKACPILINRLECLHSHDEMCPDKESLVFKSGEYEHFQSLAGDVCDKNALLHKVIAQNMKCIHQAVMTQNETCFQPKQLVYEAYDRYTGDQSDEEFEENYGVFNCFLHANNVGCVFGEISKQCGAMAKSASLDIFRRGIIMVGKFCPVKHFEDTLLMIDNLELSSEIKDQLKELFELVYSF